MAVRDHLFCVGRNNCGDSDSSTELNINQKQHTRWAESRSELDALAHTQRLTVNADKWNCKWLTLRFTYSVTFTLRAEKAHAAYAPNEQNTNIGRSDWTARAVIVRSAFFAAIQNDRSRRAQKMALVSVVSRSRWPKKAMCALSNECEQLASNNLCVSTKVYFNLVNQINWSFNLHPLTCGARW